MMAGVWRVLMVLTIVSFLGKPGEASKMKTDGPPDAIVGDGDAIRLQVYPKYKRMFRSCKRTVSIEYKPKPSTNVYARLDTVTVYCRDISKLYHKLSPGFINLGNTVFVAARAGEPIKALIMSKHHCVEKTYTDVFQNTVVHELKIRGKNSCKRKRKELEPKSSSVSITNYSSIVMLNPHSPPKGTSTLPISLQPSEYKSPSSTGHGGHASQRDKLSSNPGSFGPQKKEDPMQLLSAYGEVGEGFSPQKMTGYTSGSIAITMQSLYRNKGECVRQVVLYYGEVEFDRITVSCGHLRGLTFTGTLVKYRRAFVVYAPSPTNIVTLFNTNVGDCIKRTYTLYGVNSQSSNVDKSDERIEDDNCMKLKNGHEHGKIFGLSYDDTVEGIMGSGVKEFILRSSTRGKGGA